MMCFAYLSGMLVEIRLPLSRGESPLGDAVAFKTLVSSFGGPEAVI